MWIYWMLQINILLNYSAHHQWRELFETNPFLQQKVTKGARHKIVISIQKLKERQNILRSLEKVRMSVYHISLSSSSLSSHKHIHKHFHFHVAWVDTTVHRHCFRACKWERKKILSLSRYYVCTIAARETSNTGRSVLGSEFRPIWPPTHPLSLCSSFKARQLHSRAHHRKNFLGQLNSGLTFSPTLQFKICYCCIGSVRETRHLLLGIFGLHRLMHSIALWRVGGWYDTHGQK